MLSPGRDFISVLCIPSCHVNGLAYGTQGVAISGGPDTSHPRNRFRALWFTFSISAVSDKAEVLALSPLPDLLLVVPLCRVLIPLPSPCSPKTIMINMVVRVSSLLAIRYVHLRKVWKFRPVSKLPRPLQLLCVGRSPGVVVVALGSQWSQYLRLWCN